MLVQILSTLGLIGVPSAFAIVMYAYKRNKAMRLGMQALLRANLTRDWREFSELGYAPMYARENFENEYQQYHNLGANGVIDDIRTKFLALPDRPPKKEDE